MKATIVMLERAEPPDVRDEANKERSFEERIRVILNRRGPGQLDYTQAAVMAADEGFYESAHTVEEAKSDSRTVGYTPIEPSEGNEGGIIKWAHDVGHDGSQAPDVKVHEVELPN